MEAGCPSAVDMQDLWGYTHETMHFPSSLAARISCNTARCVCKPGVKVLSCINEHNWLSSRWNQYQLADLLLYAAGNSLFSLPSFWCFSIINHPFYPFHNPKSNVLLPHVGLLMLLFNDCHAIWSLSVMYSLCEELILGNMDYIYSLIWFLSLKEKACHKLQESHGAWHSEALQIPLLGGGTKRQWKRLCSERAICMQVQCETASSTHGTSSEALSQIWLACLVR